VKWLGDDWGCTVVRAAMGVEPEKGYLDDPEWSQEKMEAVIAGAIENDLYVIIDWHSHGIQLEAAKRFFEAMSKKYGSYPHVIYEIFNEPVNDPWSVIKDYSVEVIRTIRQNDPDNIILVGSPHWDQDIHLVADDPITGFDNLMYTLHFYAATHAQSFATEVIMP
jgi:endoglucanase